MNVWNLRLENDFKVSTRSQMPFNAFHLAVPNALIVLLDIMFIFPYTFKKPDSNG